MKERERRGFGRVSRVMEKEWERRGGGEERKNIFRRRVKSVENECERRGRGRGESEGEGGRRRDKEGMRGP